MNQIAQLFFERQIKKLRAISFRESVKRAGIFIPGALMILAVVLLWVFSPPQDIQEVIKDSQAVGVYVSGYGVWGLVVIFIVNILLVIFALLPAHLIVMASGYLYGLIPGFLLNHFSIVLGSAISFYIARRYGRPVVIRLAPEKMLDRWDKAAEKKGFGFFFICYCLPLFPADVLNFVGGLTPMKFRPFILANLLGRAWVTFAITAAGTYSREILNFEISPFVWLVLGILSIIIYWIWSSRYSNNPDTLPDEREIEGVINKPGKLKEQQN